MFNRLESSIEQACRRMAEDRGCRLIKFTRNVGDPDRILMMPMGQSALVEFKRPGRVLDAIQQHRANEWQALGFPVYRIDSTGAFVNLLDDLLT